MLPPCDCIAAAWPTSTRIPHAATCALVQALYLERFGVAQLPRVHKASPWQAGVLAYPQPETAA